MHPFWAVRRLTQEQLDREIDACVRRNKTAVAGEQERIPSFNCDLEEHTHSVVNIATVGDAVMNVSKLVKVPYMINTKALVQGEELIFPIVVKAKSKPLVRTWRDVNKEEESRTTGETR